MGIKIYLSESRGKMSIDWLDAKYSFSFANYFNPERMGFGRLRVLNDDFIAAGGGFGTHPHDNMEIVTIVLEGALEHKDSMGNHGVIRAGEIQKMSAGTGVQHSEFNHSKTERVHSLQIWVEPNEYNVEPSYGQKSFSNIPKNTFIPVVSNSHDNTLFVHQDVIFSIGILEKGNTATYKMSNKNHGAFLFVMEGSISLDGNSLSAGDSAEITDIESFNVVANENSKVLIIDVILD